VNVELETRVAALARELEEAREQQVASSDVLRIISNSTTDAQPVFQAIVDSAANLCSAEFCFIDRFDGELLHLVAHHGVTLGAIGAIKRLSQVPPGRGSAAARAIETRAVAQMPDIRADPDYEVSAITDSLQVRSVLAVPILKASIPIGVITVGRREAGYFPDRQVEVLKSFADQAFIAIQNARLFEEVQARNRDLAETNDQQMATSAILSTIAGSSTDIQPMLDVVAKSAAQLCNAFDATIYLRGSDRLAVGAHSGPIPISMAGLPLVRDVVTGRSVLDRSPVHIHDLTTAGDEFETGRKMAQSLGFRTILAVPLLRKSDAIGALMIRRTEVLPFTDKQIELLKTFADQAVIAIENVRLFTELDEALTQQTATADVLKVISRSTFDLQAVLDELSGSVARLCEADSAAIAIRQASGEYVELASFGDLSNSMKDFVYEPRRGTCVGRVLLERKTIQIADVLADPEYTLLKERPALDLRTALGVPMLREGDVIGVFALSRSEPRAFSQKQVELVEIFADQAVIAIENVRLFEEVQARNREVTEALEQQTATAEVLKTISNSAFDLNAVLHTLVKSASDLCHAPMGCIYLRDDDVFRTAMQVGWTQEFLEYMIRNPMRPGRGSASSRAALTGSVVQIPDVLADPEYTFLQGQQVGHFRSLLGVPLLRDGVVTGVFVLARPVVQPFSQREIELVQTFSDQAVIALENVRLFEEVQARTAELSEALQQQTATADVLKVISRSAFDLQWVLDTLTESAIRLCRADKGCLERLIDGDFQYASTFGFPPGFRAYADAHPTQSGRGSAVGRAAAERRVIHIEDVLEDREYTYGEIAAVGAMRTVLAVPLLRQTELIGAFAMIRTEARPFTAREIELVKTFADQAVIAIENVRLFDEVQARTAELSEALQHQTATADVLKVISRSTFDLQAVLQTLIDSAAKLCASESSGIFMRDGDVFRIAASHSHTAEYEEYERTHPIPLSRTSLVGRTALDKAIVHVPDVSKDLEHGFPDAPRIGGYKSVLCVPLMRGESVIGVFGMSRSEVGPFSERQIELAQTLADQAVIAIENVRLFQEVQARTRDLEEALQQQTATADVLKVISRSAFDLQTVLDTLTNSAAQLCNADMAGITRPNADGNYYYVTNFSLPSDWLDYVKNRGIAAGRGSVVGRVLLDRQLVHVADVLADPEYKFLQSTDKVWYRTVLGVPLLREGSPVGVLILARDIVRPFTDRQIDLIQTFADQAVIAIENARLFEELQNRTDELSRSLEDLRTAQDRLIQTEKLASLGQLTAGIAHEIKNPLNFVNNFSSLSAELIDELRELLGRGPSDDKEREEINELTGMLKGNLDKVVQHGKRADSIVKNMLLHSRAGSGEHRLTSVNAVVEESLNLAYHGARAERKDFNITLERDLDPATGEADLYPQEITRVLLNLISNGFYATMKRAAQANGAYDPVLSASTKSLGDSVEIRIRDNGTGIPPEVRESMFNPFFTTKPAGEGTGLGLSLSHDIVVKQHAGTIEVDTKPGEFTEFRIVLPRGAASIGKRGGGP
jgi:GAF domain-containing protein